MNDNTFADDNLAKQITLLHWHLIRPDALAGEIARVGRASAALIENAAYPVSEASELIEPSERQVLAALNAYDPQHASEDLGDYSPEHIEDMTNAVRAALRSTERITP